MNPPAAPAAWNQLCQLLDGLDPEKEDKKAAPSVTVLPGSWYRLLCSMNLTIDDGLDFAPWVTDGRVSESRARSLARSRVLPL